MAVYPYNSPIVLSDSIFVQFGGQIGNTTVSQRDAAYLIAEKRVSNYLGTLLIPTTVSGSFLYKPNGFIISDYGYVQEITSVTIVSVDKTTCKLSNTNGCAFIFEDTFGYLNCSCISDLVSMPYKIEITYKAGLPLGVATQPDVLLALTKVAQEQLNEMMYPTANETTGARGIEQFSTLEYSEKRKPLKRTALGQSAIANFAAELLDNAVKKARPALVI